MKKVLFYLVFALSSVLTIKANDLANFDKGINLPECLENCRYYHQVVLNLPHGSGQGICWDICLNEHIESSVD